MDAMDVRDLCYDELHMAMDEHTTPFHSHHEAKAVIEEELDEYWDLVKLNPRKPMIHPTKGHSMTVEMWKNELRQELRQIAAMAMRAMVNLT